MKPVIIDLKAHYTVRTLVRKAVAADIRLIIQNERPGEANQLSSLEFSLTKSLTQHSKSIASEAH